MCNISQVDIEDDGVTVEFHLLQTSRYGWELTLPREFDAIKVIIDPRGISVYRDKHVRELSHLPLMTPTDSECSEFLERWILV
jgi:hypothetical protein